MSSRNFHVYSLFCELLPKLQFEEIVSGGCRGTDSMAQRYSVENGIPIKVFHADWNEYGKNAGPICTTNNTNFHYF